ncbi:MAG: DNA cytosine methyltransferase [Microcystis sp. M034S1]|jgi:DNA (cytosine-5)-methyltransferase 1|uniref:DNA cytosine methyltransferase n=1 Tax=Microcystis sp. M034S1 TaxID=2771111 RepID=UPI00338D3DAF|nr:DNA cytosine methyltransferase [Microcystis sp. M034S1]
MNELALFAGAGGGILGGHLLGWKTICAVEWEPYAASVLVARQNDKILPPFPIWDDVQTFDGKPWRGIVDVVSGGFPCQDISAAGKGVGIEGKRSGMWKHMARIIEEVQPAYAYIENSPMLRTRGLGVVLQDIAKMGFDAEWGIVSAADAGAPHRRDRIWILATNTNGKRRNKWGGDRQERHILHDNQWDASKSKPERQRWVSGFRALSENVADANGWGQQERRQQNSDTTQPKIKTSQRNHACRCSENVADADGSRFQEQRSAFADGSQYQAVECRGWWKIEPNVGRVADGVAARVDRLKAIGNGQVPTVAATAWREMMFEFIKKSYKI